MAEKAKFGEEGVPRRGLPGKDHSFLTRAGGARNLLRQDLSQDQDDEGKTEEASIEISAVGVIAPEPHKKERQRRASIKRVDTVRVSSRRIKSMYENNLRKSDILEGRNNTVPLILANILDKTERSRDEAYDANSLSTVILKSLSKTCLCDVEIVGMDDIPVRAPSYLLAAHSDVFLAILHSDVTDVAGDVNSPSSQRKVEIPFAGRNAIEVTLHFLATRSLPGGRENETSEANIRCIWQIHLLGRVYKIASLTNHASGAARRLVNKNPCLAGAIFDECIETTRLLPPDLALSSSLDELKDFMLQYLRDSPISTLLGGGTAFLGRGSIEAVISDQDMDVDELTMFNILNTWVKHNEEHIETGKLLISNIKLSHIKPDYLNNVVRKCGFVESSAVDDALREIDEMLANVSPDEMEHVLVEGAGDELVNGIYVRMKEDIGLGDDDIIFVKEAGEGENFPDYGLFRHKSRWAITTCVDYSSILYLCEVPEGDPSALYQAPTSGWRAVGGSDPAPICKWNPSKDDSNNAAGYVAPALMGTTEKSIEDIAQGDYDDGTGRRYTLFSMCMLPSDEGHENEDYHSDLDASGR